MQQLQSDEREARETDALLRRFRRSKRRAVCHLLRALVGETAAIADRTGQRQDAAQPS